MADQSERKDRVVSFDSEELILVDSDDREVGYKDKAACHDGHGILHRAFSLFVFNRHGELLLQQRSKGKRLWPGYWANSCCSHPRRGEATAEAAARRLMEELGMRCDLQYLYKFEYQAQYGTLGAEHELCSVFTGSSDDPVQANRHEVEACRFVSPTQLDTEIAERPDDFTPWLKMEWGRLRSEFNDRLPLARY